MNDTTDLIERLRKSCGCNLETSVCGAEEECRMSCEAASALEAQAAEIARLRSALEEINELWQSWEHSEIGRVASGALKGEQQ